MAVTLRIDLNQISQSVSGNSSKVRVRVYATSTYGSFNNEKQPGWLKLNGVKYTFSHSFSANTTTLLYDTTRTIAHNSDGTKTVSATASYDTDVSSGTISASKSLKLTKINRRSQINSISNFTLENGTTISITKYVNNYTDMLQIYSGNTLIKTISNISNGHHVIFTQEELETLYGLSINSNNVPLKFKLTTYNGSSAVGSTETNTTGIIQISLPIITEILTNDVNDKTTTLTSDNQKYIKGYSILHCSTKAMAQKKAKINNFVIGDSLFNATYDEVNNIYYGEVNIEKINNNPVQVYAVDSRNNSASQMITLNFINYVPISKGNIEAKRENFTNEPVNISFNGTFWNNSFSDGQINNITAKYYYKNTSNSEWIQGNTNINITTDNNNFSFSGNIKGDTNIGFDINLSYNLRVVLTDKLDEVEFTSTINAGKPAIAIFGNKTAIGDKYDEELGELQLYGDVFLNKTLLTNEFMQLTLNKEINITVNANGFSAFSGILENYDVMSQSQRLTVERKAISFEDRTNYSVTGVTIGKNVSKIKATAEVRYRNTHSDDMSISTTIYRVRNGVAEAFSGASQGVITLYRYTCNLTGYIDVEEGDFIFCGSYKAVKSSSVAAQPTDNATRFIVECVG